MNGLDKSMNLQKNVFLQYFSISVQIYAFVYILEMFYLQRETVNLSLEIKYLSYSGDVL